MMNSASSSACAFISTNVEHSESRPSPASGLGCVYVSAAKHHDSCWLLLMACAAEYSEAANTFDAASILLSIAEHFELGAVVMTRGAEGALFVAAG